MTILFALLAIWACISLPMTAVLWACVYVGARSEQR